jgi:hypothetical protein
MKIQHAPPLVHERMSILWLRYTPACNGSGFWIHFEIFCLHNCA